MHVSVSLSGFSVKEKCHFSASYRRQGGGGCILEQDQSYQPPDLSAFLSSSYSLFTLVCVLEDYRDQEAAECRLLLAALGSALSIAEQLFPPVTPARFRYPTPSFDSGHNRHEMYRNTQAVHSRK